MASFVSKIKYNNELNPIGATLYGTCETGETTAQKEVSLPALGALESLIEGLLIIVKFKYTNKAESPTLKIQGSGIVASPIYRYGIDKPGSGGAASWMAGSVVPLVYDGIGWQIAGWLNTDTQYSDATSETHGLLTAAGKQKLDALTPTLVFSEIDIADDDWETDDTYPGYGLKAELTCTGVTENHAVAVTFNSADLDNYMIAPVAVSGEDTVMVFCGIQPTETVTVQSVTAILNSNA